MEGLESYKIELNEVYADKIAINSDYMSAVRPMDLFTEDDNEQDPPDSSVDEGKVSDSKIPNPLQRTATIHCLSGVDYDWDDNSEDPSPRNVAPEKNVFTMLNEKKKAMRVWKEQQKEKGEIVEGSDISSDDDSDIFEEDVKQIDGLSSYDYAPDTSRNDQKNDRPKNVFRDNGAGVESSNLARKNFYEMGRVEKGNGALDTSAPRKGRGGVINKESKTAETKQHLSSRVDVGKHDKDSKKGNERRFRRKSAENDGSRSRKSDSAATKEDYHGEHGQDVAPKKSRRRHSHANDRSSVTDKVTKDKSPEKHRRSSESGELPKRKSRHHDSEHKKDKSRNHDKNAQHEEHTLNGNDQHRQSHHRERNGERRRSDREGHRNKDDKRKRGSEKSHHRGENSEEKKPGSSEKRKSRSSGKKGHSHRDEKKKNELKLSELQPATKHRKGGSEEYKEISVDDEEEEVALVEHFSNLF